MRTRPMEQAASLSDGMEQLHARVAHRFARPETRQRALDYLQGLISPASRKNTIGLAQQAPNSTPKGLQRLLTSHRWDSDLVRDDLRTYLEEHLGHSDGVLVLDETSFRKNGRKSAGVDRQLNKSSGRMANSQVGVFLAYQSPRGQSLMDRELYLPQVWADDHERRCGAGVPEEVGFHTKAELAQGMLQRAVESGFPFAWVKGDVTYGSHQPLRVWLETHGLPHVLGVEPTEEFWTWPHSGPTPVIADSLARLSPTSEWLLISSKEEDSPTHEWNRVPVRPLGNPGPGCWLLLRRSRARRQALDFHACFGPPGTTLEDLVRLVGAQSTVHECCEEARHAVGLDQYEMRDWTGWYRHMTLGMLAQAFLNVRKSKDRKWGDLYNNGNTRASTSSGWAEPTEKCRKVVPAM